DDKMDLMKLALLELSDALRPIDRIGLVSYSNKATLLLPSTVGDKKQEINSIVESMKSGGTTSGFSGFRRAYKEVNKNLIPEGNNQVIVITDGLFNPEDSDKIRQLVEDQANQGIRTSIVGVKSATGIQRVLEQFTQKGNGAFVALENEGDRDALLMEIREASEK
ncbi:MAG: VWA domain-containing protein, partial [Flavobacteriales bacterium]|nr:VWA domain-containing protein [Flavobacteriales bacterium]